MSKRTSPITTLRSVRGSGIYTSLVVYGLANGGRNTAPATSSVTSSQTNIASNVCPGSGNDGAPCSKAPSKRRVRPCVVSVSDPS